MGFDITGLGSVFDFGSKIIDKIFPDKDAADKAKIALLTLQQQGEFKEMEIAANNAVEQIKVNAIEAANPSIFVSGWRPAAGWVCVSGLSYMVIFRPIASWIATLLGATAVPPVVDTAILLELLGGLLGLGGIRMVEKIKGVANK